MTDLIPTWVDGKLVAFDKLAAHERGLLHKAVSVFVLCGDDVLIPDNRIVDLGGPGTFKTDSGGGGGGGGFIETSIESLRIPRGRGLR